MCTHTYHACTRVQARTRGQDPQSPQCPGQGAHPGAARSLRSAPRRKRNPGAGQQHPPAGTHPQWPRSPDPPACRRASRAARGSRARRGRGTTRAGARRAPPPRSRRGDSSWPWRRPAPPWERGRVGGSRRAQQLPAARAGSGRSPCAPGIAPSLGSRRPPLPALLPRRRQWGAQAGGGAWRRAAEAPEPAGRGLQRCHPAPLRESSPASAHRRGSSSPCLRRDGLIPRQPSSQIEISGSVWTRSHCGPHPGPLSPGAPGCGAAGQDPRRLEPRFSPCWENPLFQVCVSDILATHFWGMARVAIIEDSRAAPGEATRGRQPPADAAG